MRGRKALSDHCRKCGIKINRPIQDNKRKRKDRLCNECATEIVMIKKWKKIGKDGIHKRIKQLENIIITLNKAKEDIL